MDLWRVFPERAPESGTYIRAKCSAEAIDAVVRDSLAVGCADELAAVLIQDGIGDVSPAIDGRSAICRE